MFDSITARAHIEWNVNGVCGCPSTLRRRPREGGDPYAVSRRCGTVSVQLKHPGLWVPAFRGNDSNKRFARNNEATGDRRGSCASPAAPSCGRLQVLPRCRLLRVWRERKPIRRGPCASSWAVTPGSPQDVLVAPDRAMAVGTARPAVRHREPAGRRHQYRDRGGGAAPADGYTLLLVGPSNAINATLYDKLSFNFMRDIAPVAGLVRVPHVMVVNPAVPARPSRSSSPTPRPIRARSTWRRPASAPAAIWPANCSR